MFSRTDWSLYFSANSWDVSNEKKREKEQEEKRTLKNLFTYSTEMATHFLTYWLKNDWCDQHAQRRVPTQPSNRQTSLLVVSPPVTHPNSSGYNATIAIHHRHEYNCDKEHLDTYHRPVTITHSRKTTTVNIPNNAMQQQRQQCTWILFITYFVYIIQKSSFIHWHRWQQTVSSFKNLDSDWANS